MTLVANVEKIFKFDFVCDYMVALTLRWEGSDACHITACHVTVSSIATVLNKKHSTCYGTQNSNPIPVQWNFQEQMNLLRKASHDGNNNLKKPNLLHLLHY